jgi:hypothetical protein
MSTDWRGRSKIPSESPFLDRAVPCRLIAICSRPSSPMPPCFRRHKRASPDAALICPRFPLRGDIEPIRIVAPVINRQAPAHHDVAEIGAGDGAARDGAAVAVNVERRARHRALGDRVLERGGGDKAAMVRSASRIIATLVTFRRVDRGEADVDAVDDDGIAVDDGSASIDCAGGCACMSMMRLALLTIAALSPPPRSRTRSPSAR